MKSKPEILSPAGDWTCLRTAVQADCDAVYFGIRGINMRSAATNFLAEELSDVSDFCHSNSVKCYLTLNTIIYEHEREFVYSLLKQAYEAKIDAIIAWDFAIIEKANQIGLPVHISTQMSVANAESLLFLHRQLGITRFVLARECSLDDVRAIRETLDKELPGGSDSIELECFAHGAMCVAVSGRCFLSQFQYGKSANRGECLQPCRRAYEINSVEIKNTEENQSFRLENQHVLSPHDLCTLPFLDQLINAGIVCFKIEGRNRSPEYVSVATRAYKEAVDFCFAKQGNPEFERGFEQLSKKLMGQLEKVYNRGFSSGFYMGKPIDEWTKTAGSQATTKKEYVGLVTNYYKKPSVAEVKIHSAGISLGDEIMFQGPTTGLVTQKVESMQIEHESVDSAAKGTLIAIKTDKPVRRNDKLFVVIPNT